MIIPHHDRPASMAQKTKRAWSLDYLGSAEKIRKALQYEFGDVPMPSDKTLDLIVFRHKSQENHGVHRRAYIRKTEGKANV